jgi:hypothetical protein
MFIIYSQLPVILNGKVSVLVVFMESEEAGWIKGKYVVS